MSPRTSPGLLARLLACLVAGSLCVASAQDRPLFVQPPQMQTSPAPAPVRTAPAAPLSPAPVRPLPLPLPSPAAPAPLPASGVRPVATAGRVQPAQSVSRPAAPVKLRLMPAWTGHFMVRPREAAPFNPLGLPGLVPRW